MPEEKHIKNINNKFSEVFCMLCAKPKYSVNKTNINEKIIFTKEDFLVSDKNKVKSATSAIGILNELTYL